MKARGLICDACGKNDDNNVFWISGDVRVRPYCGGVRVMRDAWSKPEDIGRRKTTFDVCSVQCLGDFLASGVGRFLPPREITGDWEAA